MSHPRTPPGTLRQTISRRLPKRPDDRGLTTLEWLLIVAAVAGLAALAVVLVQNVVSDTSEQIAGSSARLTAAKVAADEIIAAAKNVPDQTGTATEAIAKYEALAADFGTDCNRLKIIYGDVPNINVVWNYTTLTGATLVAVNTAWDTALAGTPTTSCVVTP